jgi:hypothetical protein
VETRLAHDVIARQQITAAHANIMFPRRIVSSSFQSRTHLSIDRILDCASFPRDGDAPSGTDHGAAQGERLHAGRLCQWWADQETCRDLGRMDLVPRSRLQAVLERGFGAAVTDGDRRPSLQWRRLDGIAAKSIAVPTSSSTARKRCRTAADQMKGELTPSS